VRMLTKTSPTALSGFLPMSVQVLRSIVVCENSASVPRERQYTGDPYPDC
jgi:hypothetical protein